MSNRPSLAIIAAFVGVSMGIDTAPAKAAAPGANETCFFLAPRYAPKTRYAPTEAVRFPGGARLHRPIAVPCPPSLRPAAV